MILRWIPDNMYDLMASSEIHTVRVQNVFLASRTKDTARLPSADLACRADRNVCMRNTGRKRQDRIRRRVIETKGISAFFPAYCGDPSTPAATHGLRRRNKRSNHSFHVLPPSMEVTAVSRTPPSAGLQVPRISLFSPLAVRSAPLKIISPR